MPPRLWSASVCLLARQDTARRFIMCEDQEGQSWFPHPQKASEENSPTTQIWSWSHHHHETVSFLSLLKWWRFGSRIPTCRHAETQTWLSKTTGYVLWLADEGEKKKPRFDPCRSEWGIIVTQVTSDLWVTVVGWVKRHSLIHLSFLISWLVSLSKQCTEMKSIKEQTYSSSAVSFLYIDEKWF